MPHATAPPQLCASLPIPSFPLQAIPSLKDLIHTYGIEPEVAFMVHRPLLRKCAPPPPPGTANPPIEPDKVTFVNSGGF